MVGAMFSSRHICIVTACATLLASTGCGSDSGTSTGSTAAQSHNQSSSAKTPPSRRLCREFKSHAEAQHFFEENKKAAERAGFDIDHDGVSCEILLEK